MTTVGYGDYAGGTTLELIFTLFLEFLGIVVFSVLQFSVVQLVSYESSFDSYIADKDHKMVVWMMHLEKSDPGYSLPRYLYKDMKESLEVSFRHDFKNIVEEYGFYEKLTPSLQ